MVLRYNGLGIGRHYRSTNGTMNSSWAETDVEKKSAVELLQETKCRYVKSGSVLENTQKPDRPDHLKITPPAHSFASLVQTQCISPRVTANVDEFRQIISHPSPDIVPLTLDALSKFSAVNAIPLQMQNNRKGSFVPPRLRPRAKTQPIKCAISDARAVDLRRSYSHGHSDLQSKLRQLLNSESKESLNIPASDRGKDKNIPFAKLTHKSLPDLMTASCIIPEYSRRRPSCPEHLSFKKRPPPIPPRPSYRKESILPPPSATRRKESILPLPSSTRRIESMLPPPSSTGRKEPILPPPPPPRNNSKKIPPPRPPPPKMYNRNRPHLINKSNLCSIFTGDISECINNKSPRSDLSSYNPFGQTDSQKRPIVRSISDVTHERSAVMTLSEAIFDTGEWDNSKEKLEDFFDSLGWTGNGYHGTPPKSPPVYFEEELSSRSNSLRRHSSSSLEELGSHQTTKIEPSIIEKNARVIKWLFKVQKAYRDCSPLKS